MKSKSDSSTRSDGNRLRISRTTLPEHNRRSPDHHLNREGDSFFNLLNQDSREITLVLTLEGEIKFCNQAMKTVLGYDPQRLLGNNIKRLIPVEQWVAFRAAMMASETESDSAINIDCHFIANSDRKKYFSVAVRDLRHHPLVDGYVVHAHDISRLKQQDEKLKLHKLANELIKEAVVILKWKK
jgi:PAS domain S-box-containing protein